MLVPMVTRIMATVRLQKGSLHLVSDKYVPTVTARMSAHLA